MAEKITEPEISTLVDAFYAKVRKDPEIGPIFNAIVDDCLITSLSSRTSGPPSSSPPAATKATP
jgi:truncated hemoglobin YjbI